MVEGAALAAVWRWFEGLQADIVRGLREVDAGGGDGKIGGGSGEENPAGGWVTDEWTGELGSGVSVRLQDGGVFERAGVNRSVISADCLPAAATARHPQLAGQPYQAGGVSVVVHPQNPYCPTVHLNVRVFAAETAWWFGGGMDLTPCYGFAEDCRHFHRTCRDALAAVSESGEALYPRFKKNCDEYFYLRHRDERRGVGGVFFDDFCEESFAHSFAVTQAVGEAFLPAFLPIVRRRVATPFGERQRRWQQYRRGRYVEFNLLYDRGTRFGLQAGGRTETILMSLPPSVRFGEWRQAMTAEETALLTEFLPVREWV